MTPQLRAMLVSAGIVALAGTGFYLYTPQPATRSVLELRDAGIAEGQSLILSCPEKLTAQTRRRINANQPGQLRKRQVYARIARVAKCWNPDGGTCFKPADWSARVGDLEGEIIVPSLRRDLSGIDLGGDVTDDGGDSSEAVDDANQYRMDDCRAYRCATYDAGAAPGMPWPDTPCGALNRLWMETPPCVLPACVLPDGGWDDNAGEVGHMPAPDCRATGARGTADGGPRWWGCNVMPAEVAVGTQCLPTECSIILGDDPPDVLGGY